MDGDVLWGEKLTGTWSTPLAKPNSQAVHLHKTETQRLHLARKVESFRATKTMDGAVRIQHGAGLSPRPLPP